MRLPLIVIELIREMQLNETELEEIMNEIRNILVKQDDHGDTLKEKGGYHHGEDA